MHPPVVELRRALRSRAGNPEDECTAKAQGVLDACVVECGAAPPPTCTETCESTVTTRFREWVGKGAKAERANKRAQRLFRRCVRHCGQD